MNVGAGCAVFVACRRCEAWSDVTEIVQECAGFLTLQQRSSATVPRQLAKRLCVIPLCCLCVVLSRWAGCAPPGEGVPGAVYVLVVHARVSRVGAPRAHARVWASQARPARLLQRAHHAPHAHASNLARISVLVSQARWGAGCSGHQHNVDGQLVALLSCLKTKADGCQVALTCNSAAQSSCSHTFQPARAISYHSQKAAEVVTARAAACGHPQQPVCDPRTPSGVPRTRPRFRPLSSAP